MPKGVGNFGPWRRPDGCKWGPLICCVFLFLSILGVSVRRARADWLFLIWLLQRVASWSHLEDGSLPAGLGTSLLRLGYESDNTMRFQSRGLLLGSIVLKGWQYWMLLGHGYWNFSSGHCD